MRGSGQPATRKVRGIGQVIIEACGLAQDDALLPFTLALIEAVNNYEERLGIRWCREGCSLERGKRFDKELSELILKYLRRIDGS
jgi:hypothetical protein